MENEYYGFVYITTNLINNKKYIGQRKYYKGWEKYLGSGIALKKAIKKYGKENFIKEIIENCKTKEELNTREKYWIEYYNAIESILFYNEIKGGIGGNILNEYQRECLTKQTSKRVICVNTKEIFNSIKEASVIKNVSQTGISLCCNGKYQFSGKDKETKEKLQWQYYDENIDIDNYKLKKNK